MRRAAPGLWHSPPTRPPPGGFSRGSPDSIQAPQPQPYSQDEQGDDHHQRHRYNATSDVDTHTFAAAKLL